MEIEYIKCGDYYLPNLTCTNNIKDFRIGKYGKLRLKFLKEQRKAEYIILKMNNTLQQHLLNIDNEANTQYSLLMKQLAEKENITEELKKTNQTKWVGLMNNIKSCAEEIILKEIIYV